MEKEEKEQLSQEEKAKLIKNVLEHGKDEAKYVLVLRQWRYHHSIGNIREIMGDVEYVLLHENLEEGRKEWEYAILPKTRTVLLMHEEETEFNGVERHAILYVFTQDGWKSLDLY
jgi:transcriptional regulator with AAA-type ATPase domain